MTTPLDYVAIQNTISRYCFALDTKDWALLTQVFLPDVDAKYPIGARSFVGLEPLSAAIQKRLTHITSQHAITTQHIVIAEDGKTAKATSYFTGVHFGQGKWDGKEVTAWGRYIDDLVLVDGVSVPGASGQWLIGAREVQFIKRLGEERVLEGE
ncbi:hypothetical protein AMS68_006414 [Peltaster fructicola]|uniref:SnoaL-like domain-containing protein n=1 Tax=Peltaster fructicola TaxID=286661 RepID=A0A6H0Y1N6_9PEZI|nr:hypothetical protein AMS68_006414 [Peltaster fructicola]